MPNNWFGFWQGCTARRNGAAHSICTPRRPAAATSSIDRSRAGALRYHLSYGKGWAMVPTAAGGTSFVGGAARRDAIPPALARRPRDGFAHHSRAPRCVQAPILTTSTSTAEYRRCGRGVRANQRCPPRSTTSAPCLIQHAACRTIMHTRVSGGLAPTWSCMAAHGAPARTTSAAHMLTACATAAENARAAGWLRPGPRNPAAGPPVQQPFFQMLHYPPAATQALNRAA